MGYGFRLALRAASALLLLPARALDACFTDCLRPRLTSPTIDDSAIRDAMAACRDACAARAMARLAETGAARTLAACEPAALAPDEFRKIRSASPSVVGFANSFTWDVNNVLPELQVHFADVPEHHMCSPSATMAL